jgi:hypothetical protein
MYGEFVQVIDILILLFSISGYRLCYGYDQGASTEDEYKSMLQSADTPRQGDLDGRGTLSQKALVKFCEFFLEICIDQVEYMNNLLDFKVLSERMCIHIEEMIAMKELPKGCYSLLREALLIVELSIHTRIPSHTNR